MIPPPGLQIYIRPRVTLIFDLMKVDRFMPMPRGRFVPIFIKIGSFVFAARRYASAACAVMRCGVCLSVTFVDSVKTSNHIFNFFNRLVATPF